MKENRDVILALVVLAVIFVFFQLNSKTDIFQTKDVVEETAIERAKNLDIMSFSLEGTVNEVFEDGFSATFELIIRDEGSNVVQIQEKNVKIDENTKFNLVSRTDSGIEVSPSSFSEIKIGSVVVVSTATYPYDIEEIPTSKVDIVLN